MARTRWLTAVLLAAAFPAPASAAWQPLGNVSPASSESAAPDVARGQNGDAVVAWERSDGLNSRVPFSVRRQGSWLHVMNASPAGRDALDPHVAMESDGDAVFVWRRFDGFNWVVEARTRSEAGALGPIALLSTRGQDALDPRVGLDSADRAVVSWRRFDGLHFRVQTRRRSPDGTLSPVATLSTAGQDAFLPDLAVESDGDALFAWKRSDGANARIQSRRRLADGALGATKTLSAAGSDADTPAVAIGAGGAGAVAWSQPDGSHSRVQARTLTAADQLGPHRALSGAGQNALEPEVAINSAGAAVVAWRRFDTANWRVQAGSLEPDGAVKTAQTLSGAGQDALDPRIGAGATGDATVAWRRFVNGRWQLVTRRRAADGSLTGLRFVSVADGDALSPALFVAPAGSAFFAWLRPGPTSSDTIQSRELRADGSFGGIATHFGGQHSARETKVASAADGSAVFAWRRWDGDGWRIEARRRSADGTLGPVVRIAEAALDEAALRLAVDSSGNALFVWSKSEPNAYPGVVTRSWPAGGAPGATRTVTASGRRPDLALNGAGDAFIVWEDFDERGKVVGRSLSAAGVLGPATRLSATTEWASDVRVAIGSGGRAAFLWWSYLSPGQEPLRARTRSADGTLTPIRTVSPSGLATDPALALDGQGNAHLAWRRRPTDQELVEGRVLTAADSLTPVQSLSDPSGKAVWPQVATMSDGTAVYSWLVQEESHSGRWLQTRRRTPAGSLTPVVDISTQNGFIDGTRDLAVTSDDQTVFVWARFIAQFRKQIETRTQASDGTLGAVEGLSNPLLDAGDPSVAVDAVGGATAIWAAPEKFVGRAQAAVGP
jgi:hypothetical protein